MNNIELIDRNQLSQRSAPFVIVTLVMFAFLTVMAQVAHSQEDARTGERLRALADPIGFQIGYASRTGYQGEDLGDRFERIVKAEFNIVTPENSLKWENVHPMPDTYDFESPDLLMEFAEQNGMVFHGTPLLWHRQNPLWLDDVAVEDLEETMNLHIDALVGRYAGKAKIWVVVNEALNSTEDGGGFRESIWFNAMGESYIRKAFIRARAADPLAKLIYNDFDVSWSTPKSDEMYELVKGLVEDGVPIDGVGFQMHITVDFNQYEELSTNLQRFADLGLDVYITEFDVQVLAVSEYAAQADVYEEVLRRCLAQVRCKALQIWGVDDYASWLPWFDPLPFDDEFNAKPAYYGLQRGLSTTALNVENHTTADGIIIKSGTVSPLRDGGSVKLDQVDLQPIYQSVTLRYANNSDEPTYIEIRLDDPAGGLLARVKTLSTDSAESFLSQTVPIAQAIGVRDVYVIFNTQSQDIQLDYMIFENPDEATDPADVPDTLPTGTPVVDPGSGGSGGGATTPLFLWLLVWYWVVSHPQRRSLQQSGCLLRLLRDCLAPRPDADPAASPISPRN